MSLQKDDFKRPEFKSKRSDVGRPGDLDANQNICESYDDNEPRKMIKY